ncbi:MAG: hypothetical protein CR996_00765 [Draconibacterium sp.]|nr:MAG: hypothetical protein CR996_00765 [Draconibacterium sp.]PIF05638.1 MAG: hypothetical protein CSA36_05540 [Draconibacterium sp.]
MSTISNKMMGTFTSKPKTQQYFEIIEDYVTSLGECKKEIKAQASFSVNRKFLWLWTYEKTSDGTLYMTVCLDKQLNNPHFHYVTQVSPNRWNHHIVVKSEETARSDWLQQLVQKGVKFAKK